jgi:hypothetical protein
MFESTQKSSHTVTLGAVVEATQKEEKHSCDKKRKRDTMTIEDLKEFEVNQRKALSAYRKLMLSEADWCINNIGNDYLEKTNNLLENVEGKIKRKFKKIQIFEIEDIYQHIFSFLLKPELSLDEVLDYTKISSTNKLFLKTINNGIKGVNLKTGRTNSDDRIKLVRNVCKLSLLKEFKYIECFIDDINHFKFTKIHLPKLEKIIYDGTDEYYDDLFINFIRKCKVDSNLSITCKNYKTFYESVQKEMGLYQIDSKNPSDWEIDLNKLRKALRLK